MASVNFGIGVKPVSFTDRGVAEFESVAASSDTTYSWNTVGGDNVDLFGSGFTYGADGRPTGGRATSAQIDIDGDGFNDVLISGINANPALLDDGADAFWSALLAGTSVINAQALSKEAVPFGRQSVLFGDDLN